MPPKIEGWDQATVIPQCVINRLISQHVSLIPPDELHCEDEHGSGLSDVVAGIPQVILDVEGKADRVLLVLPLLSGQLRIRENTNPNDRTAIEYAVKDWQLAFTVNINPNPDTAPNPKYKPTQKALKVQKDYKEVHDGLKTADGITIWDWLMRLGASEYGPLDLRYSSFGCWTDEDFQISEDGVHVPATQTFVAGSQRNWSVDEPKWFQRFVEYLSQFDRQLWQTITLDLFQHVAARPIPGDGQSPILPVTSLHIQQYPWLDSSNTPRTILDGQGGFNAICFLETIQGGSKPEAQAIPWQGNWIDGEYAVHQVSLFRAISPVLSRYNHILWKGVTQADPHSTSSDWELRDLPQWCELIRYWGKEPENMLSVMKERGSIYDVSFWDPAGSWDPPAANSALPSNALVWSSDCRRGQSRHKSGDRWDQEHIGLFNRFSFVPGANQLCLDTGLKIRTQYNDEVKTQLAAWDKILFKFADGLDGRPVRVLPSNRHNLPSLAHPYTLSAAQNTKAIEELEKLDAETEKSPFPQFRQGQPIPARRGPLQPRQYSVTESASLICQLTYPRASLSVCYIPNAEPDGIPPNATIAAASRDSSTIEIWWVATDGSVQGAYQYESEPWRRYWLAGAGSAVPNAICATSCDPSRIDVFWIAPDGSIQGCNFHRDRAKVWSSPVAIPGHNPASLPGTIEAVTLAPGALAVFWTVKDRIEGSFSSKADKWIARCPSLGGFDLIEACYDGEIRGAALRWQPTEDFPETFASTVLAPPQSIPGSSRLATGGHGDEHIGYWHATSSGGIMGTRKYKTDSWRQEKVAPDGSIAPGGSLQVASRALGKLDLLWISPTGVLKGCGGTTDVLSMPSYTIRDDPVAAPGSPLTVLCRREGTLDVFFRGPSGRLIAGIVNYD
ncbi:hypothetical protein N7462_006294 [Penicillium macrosclerotiorum]|uniref:uncharacterized protein n=1 Tax=Penicillium macrosclerotiorum TaxID=303699 RepID=UPI002549382B|nr:uncharacterized protein N7462_006294 [Penicillium macrosclerotiorum]KAJ5683129.1 hypothetical protein N7462_006294 [Penicillium macrosclerotiorum]